MISGPGEERWCLALWAHRWDKVQLQPTPPTQATMPGHAMPTAHPRHSGPSRYSRSSRSSRSRAVSVALGATGGPRTVRRDGGMQSHGALLVMVDRQLDQSQSTASELKCGRLWMLCDWSLALHGGPTCSASVCPKPSSPVAPWPAHLDSASVASAEGFGHDACPAPSASASNLSVFSPGRPWHDYRHMSNDGEEGTRA